MRGQGSQPHCPIPRRGQQSQPAIAVSNNAKMRTAQHSLKAKGPERVKVMPQQAVELRASTALRQQRLIQELLHLSIDELLKHTH